MSVISVIEFYSWLGVNPYIYMAIFAGVVIVVFLVVAMIQVMFSKNVYSKMGSFDESGKSVRATLRAMDVSKGKKSTAVFTSIDGEEYVLIISKIDAAFLVIGEEGELRFKGDKFLSFKLIDETLKELDYK